MVGYMEGTKAYQLWDPSTCSVVTSHDVIFDEQLHPPVVPTKPVDLTKIIWNGESSISHHGLT